MFVSLRQIRLAAFAATHENMPALALTNGTLKLRCFYTWQDVNGIESAYADEIVRATLQDVRDWLGY